MRRILVLFFAFVLAATCVTDCNAEPEFKGVAASGSSGGYNNNWAIGSIVGSFGETPAKIKPILTESPERPKKDVVKTVSDYDFSVDHARVTQPSYLPVARVAEEDLIAKNRGYAPVSVIVNADQEFLHASLPLPLVAVVPPNSEKSLVLLKRKAKNRNENIGYRLSWDIGDCKAQHNDNQNYQLPFGAGVRAFASVNEGERKTTSYTKNAVVFSMPPKTSVLAARQGIVVRMKANNKIDILHDDSTIGTYSHLGKIDPGLFVGKLLKCGDVIGTAGISENPKESFIQFTVWRLSINIDATVVSINSDMPRFDFISFPLKFCRYGAKECSVLVKSQPISRN